MLQTADCNFLYWSSQAMPIQHVTLSNFFNLPAQPIVLGEEPRQ
jgi:hypothetical protein